ncbi:MAG TPA: aspartate aminotransferase family protein [Chthoniobacteraceae bacterium]|jgi:4-aminobutyrate aminotransferase-like enzyme|nr:aspartate aminotransferase family protein [Chthoniobacteraceae bacterium]
MLPELITAVPGPHSLALAEKLRRYESRNVTLLADDWPIFWERARGTNVWDADGNRFLDLTSAFGVAGLGHANDTIREALTVQANELLHAMGDVHPTAVKAELCVRLSALTFERWSLGTGKVILGNSGFEAVEAALKTSLLHSGLPGVIAFTNSYHGLGLGALATTGLPFFREPFRAQLKDFATFLPYPHCFRCPFGVREDYRLEGRDLPNCATSCLEQIHDQIEETIRKREIGCILVEPVQGRGGCVVPPRDFLPMLRTICDTHKILLIADEIYTGFNRTGALFACEHSNVAPDIICLGKALTGGFPVSACVGRADIMDAWPPSSGEALHTSTYLGNPLGCSMALASLEQHANPKTATHVRERGAKLKAALQALPFAHVRGLGLMLGAELVKANGDPDGERALAIVKAALRAGLILLADSPDSNVLSFAPPFSIDDEEIGFVADILAEIGCKIC